jgi:hypothetical protein
MLYLSWTDGVHNCSRHLHFGCHMVDVDKCCSCPCDPAVAVTVVIVMVVVVLIRRRMVQQPPAVVLLVDTTFLVCDVLHLGSSTDDEQIRSYRQYHEDGVRYDTSSMDKELLSCSCGYFSSAQCQWKPLSYYCYSDRGIEVLAIPPTNMSPWVMAALVSSSRHGSDVVLMWSYDLSDPQYRTDCTINKLMWW